MSWCWHKWTKWKDDEIIKIFGRGRQKDVKNIDERYFIEKRLIQFRVCSKCNMKQYRRERIA